MNLPRTILAGIMQMILETQEYSFSIEEDLLIAGKEPQHQQAVRALLSDNPRLFLQLLGSNKMGLFSLSANKAISDGLNLNDESARSNFYTIFNEKLSAVLRDSKIEGRFFGTSEQVSLHNYIKQQFFEDRSRMRMDECIIEAYKDIFRRITDIDDLLYFIDFAVGIFLREHFDFVHTKCKETILAENTSQTDLEIVKIMPNLNEEQQLTIKYCFFVAVSTLGRKVKLPILHTILEEIKVALRQKPYKDLCKSCIFLDPYTFVDQIIKLEKNPREIIEYDFKGNECRLNSTYLHPDLRGHDIFESYFKKLKHLEQLIEKYEIIAHSAKVEDNKVLLGINYNLLSYDVDIGYEYTMKINNKTISEYIDFLHLLTEKITCEFIAIQEESHDKHYNVKYVCKAFDLFVSLNKIRHMRSQPYVFEHLVITLARLFIKWSNIEQIRSQQYFTNTLEHFFFLFSSIEREEQFPNLGNFESQLSKALFELLSKLESYPCESNTFKGIKSILFRWSLQLLPESDSLKMIVKKFMECFFSDSLVLKVLPREDVFETPAICKFIKKSIGHEIVEHISKRYQAVEADKINSPLHTSAKYHNNFFNKMSLLIATRILGDKSQIFAYTLMKFYLGYAHVWPVLHSFRMWILQVCKQIISPKYEQKVQTLQHLSSILLENVRNETSESMEGWSSLSKGTVELFNQFYAEANNQINSLRLKKNKTAISKPVYERYVSFMLKLEEELDGLKKLHSKQSSLKEWLRHGTSVENGLYQILQEFKVTFRYALCNSNRFLSLNEEESIMSILGRILWNTIESKPYENDFRWKFIADMMGLNDLTFKSSINSRQIMGSLQKYTAKLSGNMEQFMPFNIANSLYLSIRPNYKIILRSVLDSLLANQEQEHLWLVAQRIIVPSVLISGGCIFNGKNYDKTKEQFAFGLLYDQFEKITEVLIDNDTINQNIKIVVMLEKKKKIFSTFYDILRSKHVKIVERVRSQPEGYNRYRARNMSNDDVIQALAQMGVGRDEAEIALENIEYPDHNLAMDWIDNNTDRLDELLMNRTLERTRQEAGRGQIRNEPEVAGSQIQPLTYDRFYDKEKLIKLSRSWIVVVFKKLFKHDSNSDNQTLKNILFLFMDSLKPDYMLKQYNNLNEKIQKEIDQLNKHQKIPDQLILLLSILEGSFSKTEKAKTDFYSKAINLKILSYLPRIQSKEGINQVFSLLNATLPIFSSENINPELEGYLAYLLDLVLQYRNSEKSQCEIMLKIAKTGKQQLMQRITRNLNIFFKENMIKQSTFALISMILASDKQLSSVNAELDLKTFLYERYKHRLASFNPYKEHVLEVDINQFQKSFPKYDRGSAIYSVSKELLAKKKNKNKLLFFDCRVERNQFHYSHFGSCNFISYPLKDHFKTIIRSLLITLFEAKDTQAQDQMLTDLFKLLYNYRILLPYTVHEQIEGKNLIDWLLFSQNHSKRKYKFLAFLTLNVNLFIKREGQGYNFISLSDYICARIIKSIINSDESMTWTSFSALYLSQVRKFNEFCSSKCSESNQTTLIEHYEKVLPKVGPIEYMNISQFLYIHYKKRILDNLRRKYKFNTNNHESSFDRQFLNLSPFFNSLPAKKNQKFEKAAESVEMMPEDVDEEDEQSAELMYVSHERRLFRNRLAANEPQAEQLILPLPIPEPKEKEKQGEQMKQQEPQKLEPIVIQNSDYLDFILETVDKYLSFEIEVASKFDLKETSLPQVPIAAPNFNLGFSVKVEEVFVDIDLRVKKLTGFQKKIADIYNILAPKLQWEIKKEENREDRHVLSLGRRLMESLSNPLEANRQTLLTLERLIHNRYQREESAGQNAPPPRNLNINDIYQHLEQFENPVVPPQPPSIQPMDIEIQVPGNQPNQGENPPEAPKVESQVSQPPQELQPQQQEIRPENSNQAELVQVNPPQQPHQPQNEEIVLQEVEYQPIQEQEIEEAQLQPAIEVQTIVDNNPNQRVGPIVINLNNLPNVDEENNLNPIPVSNVENNEAQQAEEPEQPPPRQRQILSMMNLPQTFLRDVGLDEQFFDSLPEDLQQEQLLTFMAQQGATLNSRQAGNNANNSNNPPNQPQDLQSQNLAFLDSLDPQTRAQVLVEATPQFLITLPANIREEAERHRSLQINRIIEDEQIEQERNFIANQGRPKHPLVYPKVFKEEFSKLDDSAARQIFKGVFNIYPKFKLTSLKILLENKHTQDKTISSIIALIHSFQQRHEDHKWRVNKVEVANREVKTHESAQISQEDISQIRSNLLHIILEHIKIPLYKDEQFISQKLPNLVYLEQLEYIAKQKDIIDPVIELCQLGLNYYPDLATELLKKAKDLPDELFKRIVDGIKKQQWPNDFYDSLANFSENERFKEIFAKEFEAKAPKIEILGKLLKYKFAHLSNLKKIHEQALQYYSNSYIEFLNQVFAIYTVETLSEIEPLLLKHKQIHFQVIKHLYQHGRELDNEPIGIILKKPHLLDFETKKFIFRNHPKLRRQTGRRVHIEVDRTHLFQGSYNQLMNRTVRELEGRVQVAFINEPGYDAGGLRREWFLLVSRQIFNQDYGLFEKSSSGSAYQPNPKSYVNPDHLNYFKFIGRFIGKALVEKELIDAYFTRAFYKMILGQELEFKDLEAQDYDFYKSMEWLKNNPIDENMFTFSYIYDNFGNHVEKELVPGGKSIIVSEQNKKEYIEKYCMSKMRDDFSTQINKFLQGFHEVVPRECIHFFEAKELELLISGVPQVDVQDFKKNTDYSGYNPTDQIIIWFWEVVSEYSQEDLAKLVQFITGTSKIPLEGFSHLLGMNGIQRISIHRDPCDHQLPKSHTCFNQLDLPNYPSKQMLKQKLGICLAWGSEGFGFM